MGYIDAAPSSHTHSASAITSGVIAAARLGAGTPTAANFLRGDGQWATPPGGALARGGFSINSSGDVTGYWGNVSSVTRTPFENVYTVTHGAGASHIAIMATATTIDHGASVSTGVTYINVNSFRVSLGSYNMTEATGCYFAIFA